MVNGTEGRKDEFDCGHTRRGPNARRCISRGRVYYRCRECTNKSAAKSMKRRRRTSRHPLVMKILKQIREDPGRISEATVDGWITALTKGRKSA